jgi:hypothetical protein
VSGIDAGPQCPQGFVILPQAKVTGAISDRAVALLQQWRAAGAAVGSTNDIETTSGILCDYRFEWHPPDANNPVEHTGVTVYYCAGGGNPSAGPLAPSSSPPVSSAPPSPSPAGSSGATSTSAGAGVSPAPTPTAPSEPTTAPGAANGACVTPSGGVVASLEALLKWIEKEVEGKL